MLSTESFRPIYNLGHIVLYVSIDSKIQDDTICAQVNMHKRSVDFVELGKVLKFNPFEPIESDKLTQFYYRSLVYRKIPEELIFEMFKKLGIKDNDDE